MPVGVDTDLFKPAERTRPADAPLRVLTVSRLERGKGVEDLATAVGLLARRGVRVEVTCVWQGPSRSAIEDIDRHYGVSDQLCFTGGIPWELLHEVHADHDLFVWRARPPATGGSSSDTRWSRRWHPGSRHSWAIQARSWRSLGVGMRS